MNPAGTEFTRLYPLPQSSSASLSHFSGELRPPRWFPEERGSNSAESYCRQFAARPSSSHATAGSTEVGNLYCWNRHQKQQMSAQKGRDSSLTYHVLLVPRCPPDPRKCGSRKSSPDRAHVITRELAIPAEGRRCALMVQAQVVCQINHWLGSCRDVPNRRVSSAHCLWLANDCQQFIMFACAVGDRQGEKKEIRTNVFLIH